MSSTQLRAPRLRRPGESEIESIIFQQAELKELLASGRKTTQREISRAVRTGIESGDLSPGDKLPSIRRLGETLCIPNGVARRAFEHLVAQGWLEMIHGSGTYVSKTSSLLVEQKVGDVSKSVLKVVAEELTALYSTNSLGESAGNRARVYPHPRLRQRP